MMGYAAAAATHDEGKLIDANIHEIKNYAKFATYLLSTRYAFGVQLSEKTLLTLIFLHK